MNTIRIACQGAGTIPYNELLPFQGNLKSLSRENYEKLKKEIIQLGFSEPISVWKNEGKNYILNGHQRLRTITSMVKEEGFEIPPLPVCYVDADTYDQAKLKVLSLASQYGRVESQGLYEFLSDSEIQIDDVVASFSFPEVNLEEFKSEFYDDISDQASSAENTDGEKGNMNEKFIVPPFSALDAKQGYWKERKKKWLSLGIQSELGRSDALMHKTSRDGFSANYDLSKGESAWGGSGTSIFDPVLCELVYRWFSGKGATIVDPFAGGSVRGVVASKVGRQYIGIELRPEQVEANRAQASEICNDPQPIWHNGDSRNILEYCKGVEADLIFSCPPYADLEEYSDNPQDLSTLEYDEFVKAYRQIIARSVELLKPNRFACFVVGEIRSSKKPGYYQNFVLDTIRAFEDAGARFYNEAILLTPIGSLPLRAGKIFKSGRKLGKTHQNVLVFCKGDAVLATEACGEIEVHMPEVSEEELADV